MDNATGFLILIRWIVIYPVDNCIQRLNNWGRCLVNNISSIGCYSVVRRECQKTELFPADISCLVITHTFISIDEISDKLVTSVTAHAGILRVATHVKPQDLLI